MKQKTVLKKSDNWIKEIKEVAELRRELEELEILCKVCRCKCLCHPCEHTLLISNNFTHQ